MRTPIASKSSTIQRYGGTPVIFQSYGLVEQPPSRDHRLRMPKLGGYCPQFIAFELGTMFAPFGKIYDLDTYAGLLSVPQCIGAKHSSLSRELEWQRLQLRDRRAPGFQSVHGQRPGD